MNEGERITRRLVDTIGREAPHGIGRWPRAWEMVEEPSRIFLAETEALELGIGDREKVIEAGVLVRAAWKAAAVEYRKL